MEKRLDQELNLLRKYYPDLQIDENKRWIILPDYRLPPDIGWNKATIDICIEVRPGFPGAAPYGIYVPADLRYKELEPKDWQPLANNRPSFPGTWAMLSWTPVEEWRPSSDITKGSNLLNFVLSFKNRFADGQ